MISRDRVLSDFIDAWNAGERPRMLEYLRRVPSGTERDALADELSAWLEVAATPAYSPEAREAIRGEPVVRRVLDETGADLWPRVLPQLRARAGLGVRDLAARVVAAFALGDGAEERTADYLQRLENGELAPERVSHRLLDRLGELLGTSGSLLRDAASGAGAGPPPRPAAAGGLFFRAPGAEDTMWVEEQVEAISRAAMTPAPSVPPDELDRLFTGGPDA